MRKIHNTGFFIVLMLLDCRTVKERPLQDKAVSAKMEIPDHLQVSNLFQHHMVFQRNRPLHVWGAAFPGREITVSFMNQIKTAVADVNGQWTVTLGPVDVQTEPQEMKITTDAREAEELIITDILVGDVWFCSGQSNMELGLGAMNGIDEQLEDLDYPGMRLLLVNKVAHEFPGKKVDAVWIDAKKNYLLNMGWNGFSAAAFIFARRIHKEEGVPVGVIQSAFGGSRIEAWIPPEELAEYPAFEHQYKEWKTADEKFRKDYKKDPEKARHTFTGIWSDDSKLKPATAYNAMIAPFVPFAIRGVLWYQGESDLGDGARYTEKMDALIHAFRRLFDDETLPFYFAQLAPYRYKGGDALPKMWEAQHSVLKIPHTGMVVTADIGDPDDIHPKDKIDVGERFALLALSDTYKRDYIKAAGPVFSRLVREGKGLRLFFENGEGLHHSGAANDLAGFEIAGANTPYSKALARIENNTVFVWSDEIKEPDRIRYEWSETARVTLYNDADLPAMPFRSVK